MYANNETELRQAIEQIVLEDTKVKDTLNQEQARLYALAKAAEGEVRTLAEEGILARSAKVYAKQANKVTKELGRLVLHSYLM